MSVCWTGTQSSATKKAKKLRARQSDGKRKITKADISTPTNFQHIAHVGWNDSSHLDGLPQGGADGSRRIDLETQSTEERVKKIDANIGQMVNWIRCIEEVAKMILNLI